MAFLEEDDLFDMANLPSKYTGIDGVIMISANISKLPHGPQVKYFEKTGKGQPSFSVSIAPEPKLVASSLPDRVVRRAMPQVSDWVRLNRAALLDFWNDGGSWMADQVHDFVQALTKLPQR